MFFNTILYVHMPIINTLTDCKFLINVKKKSYLKDMTISNTVGTNKVLEFNNFFSFYKNVFSLNGSILQQQPSLPIQYCFNEYLCSPLIKIYRI